MYGIIHLLGGFFMRTISENFQKILMSEKLKPLMDKIREDTTLDFEIRNERIEIYYRGLELFSIYYPNNKCLFKFNEKLNFKDMDDTDSSIEEILENFQKQQWRQIVEKSII